MSYYLNGQDFPRKLSELERYWINLILPEDRPGYKIYRDKIENLFVIGYGKFPPFNLILGDKDDKPDPTIPSQALIATGKFIYDQGTVNVSIFEEFENQIEIDIQPEGFNYFQIPTEKIIGKEKNWFTYSNWKPGLKHPFDNSDLRVVEIQKNVIDLVISSQHKRIWIYDYNLKTNKFIPITNFYQEILKVAGIRDVKTMTDLNFFFSNLKKFTDTQIREAFINYNRYWKKFDLQKETPTKSEKKNFFKKIFERFLWKR